MAIRVSLSRRSLQLLLLGSPHQKLRSFSTPTECSVENILRKHGFPSSSHPHEFIQKNPFLLCTPPSDISKSISLLQSFGFSQTSLLSIISAYPKTLDLEFLTTLQKGFSELGISNAASVSTIQAILEQFVRFRIEPEDFIQSMRQMRSVGFSPGTVIRVFEVSTAAFMSDVAHIRPKIEFLKKTVGINKQEEINRICQSFPEFLAFSIDGTLGPLFSELFDLGFDQIEVSKLLNQNPRLLLGLEPGELSRCINLLEGLKCRTPIKKRILSIGRLCAAIDVRVRIDFLCSHGLTRRDVFKILHVEPRLILYSPPDLDKKIQFLLNKLGFSIDHLVEFPDYLGVNLEKQIIPRLQVVELLKSKGALKMSVEMKHFVRLSRRKFYNFFVKPYPECEKIFGGLMRDVVVVDDEKIKLKHPTGLWKLFKTQRESESEEDVKNMKQFMETLV